MTDSESQGVCPASEDFGWDAYYAATGGRDARPLLVQAAAMIDVPGDVLELGAGAGNEVRYLLDQGYRVTAVDADAGGVRMLQELAHPNLHVVHSTFDAFTFEPDAYDLVSAQFSLPFNPAETFNPMFARLRRSIRPGGLFGGNLFGVRDEWNTVNSGMTFLSRDNAMRLFDGFEMLHFFESEEERELAHGGTKNWHLFDIIARRPS